MELFGVSADAKHPTHVANDEEAMQFLRTARQGLADTLLGQNTHEHMLDDCGDDLNHATELWNVCWEAYWPNDGTDFAEELNKGLAQHGVDWGEPERFED